MNDTPCPLCNHLFEQRRLAFVKREYAELERLENEHAAHRQTCEIIRSDWYLLLWPNAQVKAGRRN